MNLLGISYGTPIAYTFAQLYPHKVNRMILAGVMKEIPADQVEDIQKSITLLMDCLFVFHVHLTGVWETLSCDRVSHERQDKYTVFCYLNQNLRSGNSSPIF